MKKVKMVLWLLLVLLILECVLAIHEYGHLREFQKRGIQVKEFSLGVGPAIVQIHSGTLTLSLRIIPIVGYVAMTEEGQNLFKNQGLADKSIVLFAGIRNNFLVSLAAVVVLQVIGFTKGKITIRQFLGIVVSTPIKLAFRFLALIVEWVTLKRVNLVDKFLLSTGGVILTQPVRLFIVLNLWIGIVNLMPVPPLDGGHITEDILSSALDVHIPKGISFLFFWIFIMTVDGLDDRFFEGDRKKIRFDLESKVDISIWEMPCLSRRVKHLLTSECINTAIKLSERTAEELMEIKGFSPKFLEQVRNCLFQYGRSLKSEQK